MSEKRIANIRVHADRGSGGTSATEGAQVLVIMEVQRSLQLNQRTGGRVAETASPAGPPLRLHTRVCSPTDQ